MHLRKEAQTPTLLTAIGEQPFFEGLSQQHLQTLADCATRTLFVPGQIILRQGDPANRFYLIENGEAVVELNSKDGKPIVIQTLGPGRELGWSWVLSPYFEHFTVRSLTELKAIFFYGTFLRAKCEEDHDLGHEVMKRMAGVMGHRIEATSQRLLEFHGKQS